MENQENQLPEVVGEMNKRRETMPDGKRYIVFYTFGTEDKATKTEVNENV